MSRIVVADDEPELGELIVMVLERLDHDVVLARSGASALTACEEHVPDLVVLDVGMPGELDGIETTRRLRRRPETRRVPVLLLSALGSEADVAAGFRAGASDYLVKPFGARDLATRVEALLDLMA